MLATYRYCTVDAGSFAGRSGLHAISGVWWVTQLTWSPSGLHLTNLYTAVAGAPAEVKGHWIKGAFLGKIHALICISPGCQSCQRRSVIFTYNTKVLSIHLTNNSESLVTSSIFSLMDIRAHYSLQRCVRIGSNRITAFCQHSNSRVNKTSDSYKFEYYIQVFF